MLYKNTAYNFTLRVSVNDDYKKTVGYAPEGYASIIVYNGSIPYVEKEIILE